LSVNGAKPSLEMQPEGAIALCRYSYEAMVELPILPGTTNRHEPGAQTLKPILNPL